MAPGLWPQRCDRMRTALNKYVESRKDCNWARLRNCLARTTGNREVVFEWTGGIIRVVRYTANAYTICLWYMLHPGAYTSSILMHGPQLPRSLWAPPKKKNAACPQFLGKPFLQDQCISTTGFYSGVFVLSSFALARRVLYSCVEWLPEHGADSEGQTRSMQQVVCQDILWC